MKFLFLANLFLCIFIQQTIHTSAFSARFAPKAVPQTLNPHRSFLRRFAHETHMTVKELNTAFKQFGKKSIKYYFKIFEHQPFEAVYAGHKSPEGFDHIKNAVQYYRLSPQDRFLYHYIQWANTLTGQELEEYKNIMHQYEQAHEEYRKNPSDKDVQERLAEAQKQLISNVIPIQQAKEKIRQLAQNVHEKIREQFDIVGKLAEEHLAQAIQEHNATNNFADSQAHGW